MSTAWIGTPATTGARTKIADLTAGQLYSFRFRTHTPVGLGEYTDVVTFRVL